MNLESLVSPVTDYLTFFVNFWFYCDECLVDFVRLGRVDTTALFLALIGTAIFLIIRYTEFKTIEPDPQPDHGGDPKLTQTTVLFYLTTSCLYVVLLEIAFWLVGTRSSNDMGGIYSTLNANFLFSAATFPVTAIQGRLHYVTMKIHKTRGWAKNVFLVLNAVVALGTLWLLVSVYFEVFSSVYGIQRGILVFPSVVAFVLFAILAVVFGKALYQWIVYVRETRQSKGQ